MKNFLKEYKLGVDFWSLILFIALMIPNIVNFCIPAYSDMGGNTPLDIAAMVFQIIGVALLIFVFPKEKRKVSFFNSLYLTTTLFVVLYYVAWIFFFFNYINFGVIMFLAVCPCAALLVYEIERRNWPALCPTVIFTVLHILSAILGVV